MKRFQLLLALFIVSLVACVDSAEQQLQHPISSTRSTYIPPPQAPRYLAFISDPHIGLGRREDGTWYPTEDFRWPRALSGFLDKVTEIGKGKVDLVIVGDFLELWQPPAAIDCTGVSADLGCSVAEMEQIASAVIRGHSEVMNSLRDFSKRGENRLHIIPGNHDSALLVPSVWRPLAEALDAASGRVNFVESGVWVSEDGRIVVEHGHQIGADVNRYRDWPRVVHRIEDTDYLVRPWGERFVQRLFNEREAVYPIIDNIGPETTGIRYYKAAEGWGQTVSDVAKFLVFNLTETSLRQKVSALGEEPDPLERPDWDINIARALGHRLFVGALHPSDPFRERLVAADPEAAALRKELDELAGDPKRLSDNEARLLCDQLEIRESEQKCEEEDLGGTLEKAVIPRQWVLWEHLRNRLNQYKGMRIFIYGHTHQFEEAWPLQVNSLTKVNILNTGAFQRIMEDEDLLELVTRKNISPGEVLSTLILEEDFPPCYTAVLVDHTEQIATPRLVRWYMSENGRGMFVESGDRRCSPVF